MPEPQASERFIRRALPIQWARTYRRIHFAIQTTRPFVLFSCFLSQPPTAAIFFLFLGFSPVVEKIPAQQSCFFWKNWIFASNFPLLRIADVNARRWPGKGGPVFFVCVSSFDRAPSFIYNSRPGGKRSGKHLAPVLSIVLVIKQLPVDCSAAV